MKSHHYDKQKNNTTENKKKLQTKNALLKAQLKQVQLQYQQDLEKKEPTTNS